MQQQKKALNTTIRTFACSMRAVVRRQSVTLLTLGTCTPDDSNFSQLCVSENDENGLGVAKHFSE